MSTDPDECRECDCADEMPYDPDDPEPWEQTYWRTQEVLARTEEELAAARAELLTYDLQAWAELTAERDKLREILAQRIEAIIKLTADRDRRADTIRRYEPVIQAAKAWRRMRDGGPTKPKRESAALIAAVDALSDAGTGQPDSDQPTVRVLSWDYREQPDLDALGRAITDLSGGALHLTNVEDTGSDQYAIVLSAVAFDQEQATGAYMAWWNTAQEVTEP